MRRLGGWAAGFLVLAITVAAERPAVAAYPENPCDHYLPTGEPLPRQDRVRGATTVRTDPTWRGQRVGSTHAGDQVDVLKECGRVLMIRTPDGVEGWVAITYLPHEEALARIASSRPITSNQDCEARYDEPHLLANCETALAKKQARDDELRLSVYLSADLIRAFVSGKTVIYTARPNENGQASPEPQAITYYQPDGEVFVLIGRTGNLWRGRWLVKDDALCLPTSVVGCGRLRRTATGQTIWVGQTGEFVSTVENGDSRGAVKAVSARFPYAAPLPVPDGLEGIAHPVMGW